MKQIATILFLLAALTGCHAPAKPKLVWTMPMMAAPDCGDRMMIEVTNQVEQMPVK